MFCSKCGTKISDDSQFCHKCGAKVETTEVLDIKDKFIEETMEKVMETHKEEAIKDIIEDTVEMNQVMEIFNGKGPQEEEKTAMGKKAYLIPVISFFVSGVIVLGTYGYEISVNKQVASMETQAEDLALKGNINEAAKLVDNGLLLRPNNKTLQMDKKFLKDGEAVNSHLSNADGFIKKKDYTKALEELDKAKGELGDKDGNFYNFLKKSIEDKKTGVTVLEIKSEMNNKNTVEGLAALLTKISSYDVKEAKDTADELRKKIGIISYNKANEFLKNNDFSGAIQAVEEGLKYVGEDKRLASFKNTINKEKASFEKAEQNRIEQAMVAAAQEDKNNKTNAVQVVEVNGSLSEYGDFVVKGKIKNIATRDISSVKIYYTVYDANNNVLVSDYTYVYPDYLKLNDLGEFQNIEYGVTNGHHIKVDNITWYLR